MRIRQKRAVTKNNNSFEWVSPLQYDETPYNTFSYDSNIGAFAIYPTFFVYNLSKNTGKPVSYEAFIENKYYMINGFYDEKTCEVILDVTVINTSSELLTTIEITFEFMPSGLLKRTISITSMQFSFYDGYTDSVRAVLEVIYIIIFSYYLLSNCSELYFEIKKTPVYDGKNTEKYKNLEFFAKFIFFIKKIVKKCFFGTRNYLTNLWNFLDMLIIVLGIWGLAQWLTLIVNRSSLNEINSIDYKNLSLDNAEMKKLNNLNQFFLISADYMRIYYFIVSKMALILTLKMMKYIISFSQKFSNLLRVLMNIFDTIIFFLILLIFCFIAFMYLYANYMGTHYPIFEEIFSAIVFLFGLLIGASKRFKDEEEENPQFTTFFYIFFSFVMVFILINLFLVIVKNELTKLELTRTIEKTKLNRLMDKYDYKPSILWRFKEKIMNFYLKFLSFFNKDSYMNKKLQEENQKRLIQNEINMNPNVNFDLDYQDIDNIYSNILENEYTIEGEKLKYQAFFKKKVVKNIWFAMAVACILVINVYVFVVLFNSSQNYEATSSILQRIDNAQDNFDTSIIYSLSSTDSKLKAVLYLSKVMPLYFTKSYLYFPSFIQNFENTTNTFTSDINSDVIYPDLSNDTEPLNFNPNDNLVNLMQNYSINYLIGYNFLCENLVRLTVRKRNSQLDKTNFFLQKLNQTPILESFAYDSSYSENENSKEFYSKTLNRTIKYSGSESYDGLGGYTFYFSPDVNNTFFLIYSLYEDGFLNQNINSMVLDFVLINPLSNNDMTYVQIPFEFDDAGNLIISELINTISRNRMKTANEQTVIGLFITIFIFFLFSTIFLVKNLKETLNGYDSWYCLFIKNTLPEALIYHRERKRPEILRILNVIMTVKFVIECFYVIFNFLFYTLYIVFLFQVLALENYVNLLGISLGDLDNFKYDNIKYETYKPDNLHNLVKILSKIQNIIIFKDLAALFASFTVFCLCFELIFYLCKNNKFNELLQAILKSLRDLPYVFLLFLSLIVAFSVSTYFYLGQYRMSFNSIFMSFTTLLQYLYRLDDMDFLMVPSFLPMAFFFSDLIPYIFIVKFLVLNLFLSIIFRAYESSKKDAINERKKFSSSVNFKEFFKITKTMFKKSAETNESKNFEIYMQTINKNNFNAVFEKFRESIETSNRNTSIHIWANICAEEIKSEQDARSLLKSKCDEISQEYFLNSYKGNLSYFKEVNKNPMRKIVEYQLRHKYWQYLYTGHVLLNNYYQYFLNKLNYLNSKLNMDQVISDQKNEEIASKKEDKITKVYIKDLEGKLEANLQDLRTLTQSQNKLLKIQEHFEEKLKEADRNVNRSNQRRSISPVGGTSNIQMSNLKKSKM